ncbi:MAG: transposase [Nitrospiria bacterium]
MALSSRGKPAQNAYIGRFNRTCREDVLDLHLFSDLDEVREQTTPWMYEYNAERPHQFLGNRPLYEFLKANK